MCKVFLRKQILDLKGETKKKLAESIMQKNIFYASLSCSLLAGYVLGSVAGGLYRRADPLRYITHLLLQRAVAAFSRYRF
ncbi:MAG: hypothetical protein COV43_06065 [Deltaproteobacteria bacterium CG11_big_fil_rev_8_21_14_0_20_42_23]|nr:MAG: hypothetical protein COV43_06065 [Deltaproteobacteria bacterium CG11_big_fil_rev_8_21_14_0_20_42_23]PJC65157.1 MAG: hypothetical protein CO021_00460 [Deltaproteobacteria bacterium CG_4_9_14_0_2_um_filter_42_21]